MKAKVVRGGGFRGALNYGFGKDEGELVGGNMVGHNPRTLASEFGASVRLRPDIDRAVWHCSLSAAPGERLSDQQWSAVGSDFLKMMKFGPNHQFVVVRHKALDDQKNPAPKAKGPGTEHVHIYVSRIGLDGKLWSGEYEALNAIEATQKLEKRFGLVQTKGLDGERTDRKRPTKPEIEMGLRTGVLPPRVALQGIVSDAMRDGPTVQTFVKRIHEAGAVVRPSIASTGRMNGFSFGIDDIFFTGQKLGAGFTWSQLLEKGLNYEQARDAAFLANLRAAEGEAGAGTSQTAGAGAAAGQPATPAVPAGAGLNSDSVLDSNGARDQEAGHGHRSSEAQNQGAASSGSALSDLRSGATAPVLGGSSKPDGISPAARVAGHVDDRPTLFQRLIQMLRGLVSVKQTQAAKIETPKPSKVPQKPVLDDAERARRAQLVAKAKGGIQPSSSTPTVGVAPKAGPAKATKPMAPKIMAPRGPGIRIYDPTESEEERIRRDLQALAQAIDAWKNGQGEATDSKPLLRRAIALDSAGSMRSLSEGSFTYDRSLSVGIEDIDEAGKRDAEVEKLGAAKGRPSLLKEILALEGSISDVDALTKLAQSPALSAETAMKIRDLAAAVAASGGDMGALGINAPQPVTSGAKLGQSGRQLTTPKMK